MNIPEWLAQGPDPRVFTMREQVRFRHCDPAGIVFYPRYFEMLNDFVEAWFEQALGASFHRLHEQDGIGTPTASVQCDFVSPSRWHDVLIQHLHVQRLGGASVQLVFAFTGEDGSLRLSGRMTVVTVDLKLMRSRRIPDSLRASMARYLIDPPVGVAYLSDSQDT